MKKFLPTSNTLSVNKKGFTLVELLVVITIIAILSVIGITVFTGVQKNARDARRRADIESISKAFEITYSGAAYRPLTAADFSGPVPQDPLGGNYSGYPGSAGSTYSVCADLEADGRAPTDTTPNDVCRSQQQ